jgi:hypothetical protein
MRSVLKRLIMSLSTSSARRLHPIIDLDTPTQLKFCQGGARVDH